MSARLALRLLSLCFGLLLWCSSPAADAQSADCARAATTVEKTICADKELTALDHQLAQAYRAAFGKLSPEGRNGLRDGQRQWLAMLRRVCDIPGPPKSRFARTAKDCIEGAYKDRLGRLMSAVQTFGAVTIRRVDRYVAQKSSDDGDTGSYPGYAMLDLSYPEIDAPKNAQEIAFNRKMESFAQRSTSSDDADTNLSYDALSVSGDLISVDMTEGEYEHGAAHGNYATTTVNWLLREGREVFPADVFRPDSGWKAFLRDYCFRGIAKYGFVKSAGDLHDSPADPETWKFGRDGLTIGFQIYQVASYADGQPSVTVPWRALKPYLKGGAPPAWAY